MPRSVRRAFLEKRPSTRSGRKPQLGRGHEPEAARDVRQVAPRLRGGARRDVAGHNTYQVALRVPAAWDPGKPGVVGTLVRLTREARSDRASEPPVPVVVPDRAPAVHAGPQVGDAVVACAFNLLTPTAGPCRPPLRRPWFALRHSLPRGRFCRLPCGRGAMDRPRGLDTL